VAPGVVRVVAPGGIRVVLRGLLVLLVLPPVALLLVALQPVRSLLAVLPVGAFLWGCRHFLMLGSWCLLGRAFVSGWRTC
jgi:hypothetical protein